MTIKVIAREQYEKQTTIFYLNLAEPKQQQLYKAIITGPEMTTLTVYNVKTNTYEDVTTLFQPDYLNELTNLIVNQIQQNPILKAL